MRVRLLVWMFVGIPLSFLAGGCGADDDDETPGTAETLIGEVTWAPCDTATVTVDCATVEVPLDWDDPTSRRIQTFVRRLSTSRPPSRGQLWYLTGGPGYNNGLNVYLGTWFAQHGYDVYLMDYRGVGASTSLDCDGDGANVTQACLRELWDEWGDGLRHFSTTGAALDLGALIEATRKPGEEVVIVGASYGTYLTNRYLHLFPGQADAVIQDGVCPPEGCSARAIVDYNRGLEDLHRLCAEDDFCRGKLGPDPWARTLDLLQRLDEGHCNEFFGGRGREYLTRFVMDAFLMNGEMLSAALASIHRVDRCEAADVEAVTHFFRLLSSSGAYAQEAHDTMIRSSYLYYHLMFSELWSAEFDLDAYEAELRGLPFRLVDPRVEVRKTWIWPLYETPEHLKTWAPSSVPMLFLNGTLDVQTPIWDLDGLPAAYSGERQHFIVLPTLGHGSSELCPWALVSSFLLNPNGNLPSGCVESLGTIDWAGNTQLALQLMGTDDLWSNEAGH